MAQPAQITTISKSAAEYTISDLSRMYGVSLRTLRFYEDKELLSPRRAGTARYYSARDRVRLELVLTGKRLGFTLAEIWHLIASRSGGADAEEPDLPKALSKSQLEKQIVLLEQRRATLGAALDELREAQSRHEELHLAAAVTGSRS